MIKVGVIGLGMMGGVHLRAYAGRKDARVVAVADRLEERRTGKSGVAGNIGEQGEQPIDFGSFAQYADGSDLIASDEVDLVDICLPTPLHPAVFAEAVATGKHVLIEKPLARTAGEADEMARVAATAKGMVMPAMCMRFWPGWDWVKQAVDEQTYGPVRAATFTRLSSFPGGPFYSNGDACGGAILDLHIHDTDFIQHCFGMPEAVSSVGYTRHTGKTDHVVTQYHYADGPMVVAEGGWAMNDGFGFAMRYAVNFERATAVFDIDADPVLKVVHADDSRTEPITLDPAQGYEREIDYFLTCITNNTPPQRITFPDAAKALRIYEAEVRSVETGQRTPIA